MDRPQRVGHDQQVPSVVVGGFDVGLDDEHILAADVFVNFDKDFRRSFEPFDSVRRPALRWTPRCSDIRRAIGFGQRHFALPEIQFGFGGLRPCAKVPWMQNM